MVPLALIRHYHITENEVVPTKIRQKHKCTHTHINKNTMPSILLYRPPDRPNQMQRAPKLPTSIGRIALNETKKHRYKKRCKLCPHEQRYSNREPNTKPHSHTKQPTTETIASSHATGRAWGYLYNCDIVNRNE